VVSDKTRKPINDRIVRILEKLFRAQYLGYTATPFATVFIESSDTMKSLGYKSFASLGSVRSSNVSVTMENSERRNFSPKSCEVSNREILELPWQVRVG
jgi:hypothetical protein